MRQALVLASGSATRRMLMDRLRLEYEVSPANIDERPRANEPAAELAARLAYQKASAVGHRFPTHQIIGSDQVAVLDGQFVGKPGSEENACAQLRAASGKTMHFYTSVCLLNSAAGTHEMAVAEYQVRFRTLNRHQIDAYVRTEQPLDCCGSFRAEGLGIALFESHRGEDPTALLGLPLMELSRMLDAAGLDVLRAG